MKITRGLTYSWGDVETGVAGNIDAMGHPDPEVRATARLNRDLVAVMDKWMANEQAMHTSPLDVLPGAMHGFITIFGTLLGNQPPHIKAKFVPVVRQHLLAMFDAMSEAISKDGPS